MESFPISNINSYDDLEITQLEDHDCSSLLFFFPSCGIRKTDYVINVFILILHVHGTVTMKNSTYHQTLFLLPSEKIK